MMMMTNILIWYLSLELYFTDQMQLAFEFVHLTQQIRIVSSFQHDFDSSDYIWLSVENLKYFLVW
jgi:hypothetical protein